MLFASCGPSRKIEELKKYEQWVYYDSLRIVDLDMKYLGILMEIESLKEQNKYLDSLLTVCESKKQK